MSRIYRVLLLVGLLAFTGVTVGPSSSDEGPQQVQPPSDLDTFGFGTKSFDGGTGHCEDGGGRCFGVHQ
jgi:hypothetical protein